MGPVERVLRDLKHVGGPEVRARLWARVKETAAAVSRHPADRARLLELGYLDRLRVRARLERLGLHPVPQAAKADPEAIREAAWMLGGKGGRGRAAQAKSVRRFVRRHVQSPPVTFSQKSVVEWTAWLVADVTGALPRCGRYTEPNKGVDEVPRKVGAAYGPGLDYVWAVLAWAVYPLERPRSAETVFGWLQDPKDLVRPPASRGKQGARHFPDLRGLPRLHTEPPTPETAEVAMQNALAAGRAQRALYGGLLNTAGSTMPVPIGQASAVNPEGIVLRRPHLGPDSLVDDHPASQRFRTVEGQRETQTDGRDRR